MMGFGLLFTLLIIGVIAYAMGWGPEFLSQGAPHQAQKTPLEILKERYARGEISQEEYHQMHRDLG